MDDLRFFLEYIGESLTLVIMIVALFGLIIPIFPGTVIIRLYALLYGFVTGFTPFGIVAVVIITILAILSAVADNVMMGAKAREVGAPWSSILLALGGGIIFTFVFPPIGGLIAAPVILYLWEYQRQRDSEKALKTVKALLSGWGWGFVIRFGLGVVMIGLWGAWALSN